MVQTGKYVEKVNGADLIHTKAAEKL